MTLPFRSILFEGETDEFETPEAPAFFGDLHLDQILGQLVSGREEYELGSVFYRPLHDARAVRYRHHVLTELEQPAVLDAVRAFARGMQQMRERLALANRLHYSLQKQRWFLDATVAYCESVRLLAQRLAELELCSSGLVGLRDYLVGYTRSDEFSSLTVETRELLEELSQVRYAVQIKDARVTVSPYRDERDMSAEVERTFERFKRGAMEDHRVRLRDYPDMNHVEAQILDRVAKLYPDAFARLGAFYVRSAQYLDRTIGRLDRELQFYLAYLDYIEPLRAKGLMFSLPRVSTRTKEEHATATFDLALAHQLLAEDRMVVCNDLRLSDPERVLVISGPNNGGKTTFARMYGQLHYLASLGLPVPGSDAEVFLPDQIFTHFEREEDIETLRGKFEDELYRIHEILEQATSGSLLIMNETFGSTTRHDAVAVGTEVMRQIIELDALCVFVTFVDELASLGESTVSMMGTVLPDDPAVRTYKVVRKAADGLAYAAAIAEKHGLSYEALHRRLAR